MLLTFGKLSISPQKIQNDCDDTLQKYHVRGLIIIIDDMNPAEKSIPMGHFHQAANLIFLKTVGEFIVI